MKLRVISITPLLTAIVEQNPYVKVWAVSQTVYSDLNVDKASVTFLRTLTYLWILSEILT